MQHYSKELLDIIRDMVSPNVNARPSADELLSCVFASAEQLEIRRLLEENRLLREALSQAKVDPPGV